MRKENSVSPFNFPPFNIASISVSFWTGNTGVSAAGSYQVANTIPFLISSAGITTLRNYFAVRTFSLSTLNVLS
jgi:hypothetical protein